MIDYSAIMFNQISTYLFAEFANCYFCLHKSKKQQYSQMAREPFEYEVIWISWDLDFLSMLKRVGSAQFTVAMGEEICI